MTTDVGADERQSIELTEKQIRGFADDGFLVLDSVTSAAEVADLRLIYDRLFEDGAGIADSDRVELAGRGEGGSLLPQILNPDHYAPELLETTAYRNARSLAQQLLGESAHHMGMHAIRKPPLHGAETPWHQDEAYWDPQYDHPALSVWIPLQPATPTNGCMQFVPGSHLTGVRHHRLIDEYSDGLVVSDLAAVGTGVVCPIPAGGATIHAARTLHYAGPNLSDEPRRALIMAFRCPPQLRLEARSFPWQRPEWYE